MAAIRLQELTKRFGPLTAVDRLTLEVETGEIFGLVGPDGAGKSTTMRLLTSILDPTSGDAWVDGSHIVREGERIKEKIGYMSQRFGLYADLTVMENLNFYADIFSVRGPLRRKTIQRLLEFSNLGPFLNRLAGRLSGGMKQKLGLACALVHKPKILFLDEPTNGVDPVSRRDFWQILYQLLIEKVTIFISTAYLDEAERCGRLALIDRGKLIARGTPDEIKARLQGTLLEIRAAEPRRVLELLRSLAGVVSVHLFGDRIHLLTRETQQAAVLRIEMALETAGLRTLAIRPMEPMLEDIFISELSDRKETKHAGPG